ncbi:hypothetical protein F5X97DRAFT_313517 [Nemania serpens]|nr:hypothetical protein F5X97DRAFT_313517 [Nemania serpens]
MSCKGCPRLDQGEGTGVVGGGHPPLTSGRVVLTLCHVPERSLKEPDAETSYLLLCSTELEGLALLRRGEERRVSDREVEPDPRIQPREGVDESTPPSDRHSDPPQEVSRSVFVCPTWRL